VKGTVKSVDARGAFHPAGRGRRGLHQGRATCRAIASTTRPACSRKRRLESRFIGVDRKNRIISLSVKAKEIQEEEEAVADYRSNATSGKTSLGDILKEQIGGDER